MPRLTLSFPLALSAMAVFLASGSAGALPPPTNLQIELTGLAPTPCPRHAQDNDKIIAHYTGRLWENGKQFETSKGGAPFSFTLGKGQVIAGWDRGFSGVCPGENRTLTIPSAMAYGAGGSLPVIPPNAVLIFDVEVISVTPGGQ